MKVTDSLRAKIRKPIRSLANTLNTLSQGKISPDSVTIFGLTMHLPVAVLIAGEYFVVAAILLIVFGLFDALDGELARLQGKASSAGMLLDASTDRFKEVLLYTGTAYYLGQSDKASWAYVAVLACGAALSVSYIKAKGESAIAISNKKIDHHKLNRMFSDGLASFDIRILLLIIGLLTHQLLIAITIIAVLASLTAIFRLIVIRGALKRA